MTVGPPDIATTWASSQKMSSMTLKNRSLNCCKPIFVNEIRFDESSFITQITGCVGDLDHPYEF